MAKIFLDVGETNVNIANDGDKVYGQTGDESVNILEGVTGVVLDGNVDAVTLDGDVGDYLFQQQGNQLRVYSGTELVATIPVQTDEDGTQVTFGDGTYTVEFGAGAVLELGGETVPSEEPGPVVPPTEAPTLTISDVTVAEGDTGTATATFTVTLSEAPGAGETVTVDYATADVTATAGTDYVAAEGTLNFTQGETTKTIEVTVNGDTVDEVDETFNVVLSDVTGTISGETPIITDSTGAGTITDDDVAGETFTLTASASEVNEGEAATFEISNAEANTEYAYKVTGDGAAAEINSVTTGADGKATITVNASDVLSTDETFTVTIIGEDASATVTAVAVNDAPALTGTATTLAPGVEDTAYTVAAADLLTGYTDEEGDTLSVANLTADNDATVVDNGDGTYTVTPAPNFNGDLTLSYEVTDGADAVAATQTVNFAAVNDLPTTTAATAAATEAGDPVEGQLVAEDVDGDDLTFTLDAAVDGLALNADGSYSFNPADNPAVQALTYTDVPLDVVANYTVDDGNGGTAPGTLTITVDPTPLTFELQQSVDTVEEGSVVEYTIVASEAVQEDFTGNIQIKIGEGDTAELADFGSGSFNPQPVTIAAGTTTSTVATITPTNDAATEMPETFTATATVTGYDIADIQTTVQDPSSVGGLGQTFTLTTGVDEIPGLVGSAGSTGTDGDDTIVGLIDKVTATNTTLNELDSIDAGLGDNLMKLNVVGDYNDAGLPAGVTLSNVQTLTVRGSGSLGDSAGDFDISGVTDLETANFTLGNNLYAKVGTGADVNVSGQIGVIDIQGGKNIVVDDATADNDIIIGAATAPAGTITVTDTDQGTGNIAVDGGTDITVNTTNGTGTTTIGGTTAPTGAVVVNTTLESDGAALAGGAINVTGGTTIDITVDATNTADASGDAGVLAVGTIKATAGDSTTNITITQNLTNETFTSAATGQVTETASVKFGVLKDGDVLAVGGLIFTADKDLTAEEVAQAFSDLTAADTQGDGPVSNGIYTGALAGWTSAEASGDTVVFTSTVANTNVVDLTPVLTNTSGNSVAPTVTTTDGAAGTAATTSTNTTTAGNVQVDDNATASVTDVTIDTYGVADLGDAGTDLDALANLSLANSAGAADVATDSTTLALTVDNVNHAVNLDNTAATIETLNVTTTGDDSTFTLTAAAVKTLNVSGDKDLDISGAALGAVETVKVTGSAGLSLAGADHATIESVDTTGTTGTVISSILGNQATYSGGEGVDILTIANADTAVSKAIDLGKGNDTLTLVGATVVVPTEILKGGEGDDTLSIDSASADALDGTTTFSTKLDSFETLFINTAAGDNDNAADTVTLDMEALGFNTVISSGTVSDTTNAANSDTLVFDNMTSGATVIFVDAPAAVNTKQQVNIKDAASSTEDVFNGDFAHTLDYGTLTVDETETINLNAGDIATVKLDANKATTVNLTGSDFVLDTTGTEITTVDASELTGGLTYTADGATAGTTVKGGEGADTLIADGSEDILYGNDGDDILVGTTLTQMTGGDGNDTFIGLVSTNVNSASAVLDPSSGDVIELNDGADEMVAFDSAQITLDPSGDPDLQNYADAAINGITADNNAAWFQYNSNTYIVMEANSVTTPDSFVNGEDVIIKLVGLHDLSTASFNATEGTLELA